MKWLCSWVKAAVYCRTCPNYIDEAGAAFVFARQGSSWNFINKLVPPPGNLGRVTPPYSIFYTYNDTGLFDAFAFKGLTVVGGHASTYFDSTGSIQTAGAGAIFTFQAP